ncbi:MAG TPA: STAS domain-containing protein [Rectinemataceae bacterium]|nr:STAS domain-containing protein [Rectinemataceae bacterium]
MTQLDISERQDESRVILLVSGPINSYTFSEFQQKLDRATAKGEVVIDMEKVTTLSSAGIGVIMAALDDAEAAGKKLFILKPSEIARLAFESTGFMERFPVFQNLKELP